VLFDAGACLAAVEVEARTTSAAIRVVEERGLLAPLETTVVGFLELGDLFLPSWGPWTALAPEAVLRAVEFL
jgi:hypothetical protein